MAIEEKEGARTLKNAVPIVVADVVRSGEKLSIPPTMTLTGAIDLIKQRIQYEDADVAVTDTFDVFPWDGAVALDKVLTNIYGWAPAVAQPGFFGPKPPQLISVEVQPNKFRQVPWGAFQLPNIEGRVNCGVGKKEGRVVFALNAIVKRRDELAVRKLFDAVRVETQTNSIYRGQAIKLRFMDDNGERLEMPEPKFMDTTSIDENSLIYSRDVERSVRTNLFVPVTRAKDCLANGIPVKRGILLGGTYGTGKTLAAAVASKLAVQSGITYLYIPRVSELSDAIQFAKQYQSPACVIFCEDIDRTMSGERSVEMDDVLNTIDGIDSKTSNIIVVLTTNALDEINPAMLRPGRLDAVIEITPPDAEACERLLRYYGKGTIPADESLVEVGKTLAGCIPAVIAEVVKRAKLAQLGIQETGTYVTTVTAAALLDAASTMSRQMKILARAAGEADETAKEGGSGLETALADVVRAAVDGNAIRDTRRRVKRIEDRVAN